MDISRALRARLLLIAALAVLALACSAAHRALLGPGGLEVAFLDVGQGDSIYIRTPSGKDMLVDGGPSASTLRMLAEAMPWHDRSIDVVVATHPDADHIGGLPEILRRYRVSAFVEPGVESKNAIDDEIHATLEREGIARLTARRGLRIDFGDGAAFDVLLPDRDVSGSSDTNGSSIVGRLAYGGTAFVLTGDAGKAQELRMVGLGDGLAAAVLKAGHHGSKTSSDESFVRAVNPRYVVISSGKGNRYGHPDEGVLRLLGSLGIEALRTDELGTITFFSDGCEVALKEK